MVSIKVSLHATHQNNHNTLSEDIDDLYVTSVYVTICKKLTNSLDSFLRSWQFEKITPEQLGHARTCLTATNKNDKINF